MFDITGYVSPPMWCELYGNNTAGIAHAVNLAKESDMVLLTMGGPNGTESHDREIIGLPPLQQLLVEALLQTRVPLVAILFGDGSLAPQAALTGAAAVLHALIGGQGGGQALAEIVVGAHNPSGALPVTIYMPEYIVAARFSEHSMSKPPGRSYRWVQDQTNHVLMPFGSGLSYSTWSATLMEARFPSSYNTRSCCSSM